MNRTVISTEKTKDGTVVQMQGPVDVKVQREHIRTLKADGTPLKRPVKELYETVERRSGVVTRLVKRRKTLRKLGL